MTMNSAENVCRERSGESADSVLRRRRRELEREHEQLEQQQEEIERVAADLDAKAQTLARDAAEIQQRKRQLDSDTLALARRRSAIASGVATWWRQWEALSRDTESLAARQRASSVETLQLLGPQEAAPAGDHKTRGSKRVSVCVDVSLSSEHNFYVGLSENLSEGGVFIATYDELSVGTELDLTVSLPDRDPINVRGVIRWVRSYSAVIQDAAPGVGVQFIDLAEADRQTIADFLTERDPLLFDAE